MNFDHRRPEGGAADRRPTRPAVVTLVGVGLLLLLRSGSLTMAADYAVATEQELRDAIDDASADGDAASTITLTSDISITNPLPFSAITKPLTIDTEAFTLANDPPGVTDLSFSGGPLTLAGAINGNVLFGSGDDRLELHSGTITGAVAQGGGTDVFLMTDGEIQSLNQGGNLDFAEVHGGRIVGLFFAGDFFTMTGGRIGQVNLEQANNEMRMSGGVVDDFVIAAQQNDLLELSGGAIGSFVNLGNGNDTVIVTGGSIGGDVVLFNEGSPNVQLNGNNVVQISGGFIGGEVRTGQGSDRFTWDSDGAIGGAIVLGAGDDTAALRNLTEEKLSSVPLIDGGSGVDVNTGLETDRLTFDNTTAATASRYVHWEEVSLINSSELTLDSDLVLGDVDTGAGTFDVDATSTLLAGAGANASVAPFTAGQLVEVTNAGAVDLTNGATGATDTLTIDGHYVGLGGTLLLQTELGGDGSPSDLLVVTGDVSGATAVRVVNFGGAGAQTTGDGIQIVDVGGTSTSDAFALAEPVRAGAYGYDLFFGGASGPNDWFLRSTALRPATAVYPILPSLAQEFGARVLGTLHRRVGQQEQLRCRGDLATTPYCNGGWGRVIGVTGERTPGNPDDGAPFNYDLWAVQAGRDLYRLEYADGSREHAGLYFAGGGAAADVFEFGGANAGDVWFGGYALGGYWTWYGANQWYLDTVIQSTWYDTRATTSDGDRIEPDDWGGALSLEGGYPLFLRRGLVLEPQAQLVYQGFNAGTVQDAASTVSFDDADSLRGRAGLRLAGTRCLWTGRDGARRLLTVALTTDAWREFEGDNLTTFAAIDGTNPVGVFSDLGGSWGEVGADATTQLNRYVSLYGSGHYARGFDGDRDAWTGAGGVRVNW